MSIGGLLGARRPTAFTALLVGALALSLAFLALPVLAIFTRTSPTALLDSLGEPATIDALRLSLLTSVGATTLVVLVGTPAAYLLATARFPGRELLLTLLQLPLVLPPAVAGIGLLAALGPHGLLGPALEGAGVRLVLSTAGVVVAMAFVSAPFFLRQAEAAFAAVDPALLETARTLGAGPGRTFGTVAVPGALSGIGSGVALCWARAVGEFGATLMFAGSFQGVTQTAPLAIYERFAGDFTGALALSAVLVVTSGTVLVTLGGLGRASGRRR